MRAKEEEETCLASLRHFPAIVSKTTSSPIFPRISYSQMFFFSTLSKSNRSSSLLSRARKRLTCTQKVLHARAGSFELLMRRPPPPPPPPSARALNEYDDVLGSINRWSWRSRSAAPTQQTPKWLYAGGWSMWNLFWKQNNNKSWRRRNQKEAKD